MEGTTTTGRGGTTGAPEAYGVFCGGSGIGKGGVSLRGLGGKIVAKRGATVFHGKAGVTRDGMGAMLIPAQF